MGVTNLRIWELGRVYVGELDATPPDDVATPLDENEWAELGLLTTDGLTESKSLTVDKKFAWGGASRNTKSEEGRSFKFAAHEDNEFVFDLRNPGSTQSTDGGVTTRNVKRTSTNLKSFVLELIDGDVTTRKYVPIGEVDPSSQETVYSDQDLTAYEFTVDATLNDDGDYYIEITDDPASEVVASP